MTTANESTPASGAPMIGESAVSPAGESAPRPAPDLAPAGPVATPVRPWFHVLRPAAGETSVVLRLALGLLLAGLPLGVLWWLISPRRSYQVSADGAFATVPDSEAAVGSDGWFLLLALAVAVVVAVLAWRREAQRGPLMAVGLGVGMLACGLVAWQVGMLLGPGPTAAELKQTGTIVLGPLQLRAYGVLVVGPFVAVATYLLAACFTSRDDLRRSRRTASDSAPAPLRPAGPDQSVAPGWAAADRTGSVGGAGDAQLDQGDGHRVQAADDHRLPS